MADRQPSSPPVRRRNPLRRWLRRLPLIALAFLATVVALTQILLWSDLPRRIAEREISRVLRAHATVGGVSISWGGRTKLTDVAVTLPLADTPALRARSIEVSHTALPLLVWDFNVRSARVDGASVRLQEDTAGRWNLAQLLAATEDAPSQPAGPVGRAPALPALPEVRVDDATIDVIRPDGRQGSVTSITLHLAPVGRAEYRLTARAGDDASLDGRFAAGAGVTHAVRLRLRQVPVSLRPAVPELPQPLTLDCEWSGRVEAGARLAGQVHFNRLTVGDLAVDGSADASLAPGLIGSVAPHRLNVRVGDGPSAEFDAGRVRFDSTALTIERVRAQFAPAGAAVLEGRLLRGTQEGTLSAAWDNVRHAGVASSGRIDMTTRRPLAGGLQAEAKVVADAATDAGRLGLESTIRFEGTSPDAFEATVSTAPLTWVPRSDPSAVVRAPALRAVIVGRGNLIELTSLTPQDSTAAETLQASGAYDRAARFWWASLDGRAVKLQRLGIDARAAPQIDVNVDAYGSPTRANVRQAFIRTGRARAWASGYYDTSEPEPLRLDTWAWLDVPRTAPDRRPDRTEYRRAAAALRADDAQISGLVARGVVAGTLEPRNLRARGVVTANDLLLRGRRVGDVQIDVEAEATGDAARLQSNEVQLLDARWTLIGEYSRRSGRPPRLLVAWRELPLDRVGELFGIDPERLDGVIDRGDATIDVPSAALRELKLRATAEGSHLRFDRYATDRLTLSAELNDGTLVARPVATFGDGRIDSEVTATVVADESAVGVGGDELIRGKVTLTNWHVVAQLPPTGGEADSEPISAVVSGDLAWTYDARLPGFEGVAGDAAISARLRRDRDADQSVGSANVRAALRGGRINLSELTVEAIGGTMIAAGAIDLADLQRSRLDATFNRLSPADLAWLAPPLAELRGRFSGFARVAPAVEPRPLAPVELRLSLRGDGDEPPAWRKAPLESLTAHAFAAYESPESFRLVIASAEAHVAGGVVKPFARVSRSATQPLTQLFSAEFSGIDLEPVAASFDDDGRPVRGRLAGEVRVYGQARAVERLSAEGRFAVTESDLANFGPIAAMYDAMRIGTSGPQPRGEGSATIRVEDNRLTIVNAAYFNRGAYITGYGTVTELQRMPESPLNLTLIGSAQPLRDIRLPLFADADKLMEVLQTSVTTIRAEGTLKDPVARQATLSELGSTARKFLLGQAGDE